MNCSIKKPILDVAPGIKALIFDLDGTLADTMGMHFKAWMKASAQFGFPFSQDVFLAHAGMPSAAIIDKISRENNLDLHSAEIEGWKERYYFSILDTVRPIPVVDEIVRKYQGVFPMAIGTGSTLGNARRILAAMKYPYEFSVIVGSDCVKHGKPDPETFLQCARLLRIFPQYCQVFEDGQTGLDAALAAGMTATDIRPYL